MRLGAVLVVCGMKWAIHEVSARFIHFIFPLKLSEQAVFQRIVPFTFEEVDEMVKQGAYWEMA